MRRRVGIVGAGGVTVEQHLPVLSAMDDVEVVWLCDTDRAKAEVVARRFGVRSSVRTIGDAEDVEAILVATPVGTRRPILEQAFARGWHVLSEKPFAASLADHDAFVAMARAANRRISVGLMRRFYRSTQVARRLLTGRPFGAVIEVLAGEGGRQRGTGRDGDWYQADPAMAGGGILVETGSHLLDQACFSVSASDVEVRGYEEVRAAGLELDGRIDASLTCGDEVCPARFLLSKIEDVPNGIWVRCATATVAFDSRPDSPVRVLDREGRELGTFSAELGATHSFPAFHLEWRDFLDACASPDATAISDAASARVATAIIDASYERARRASASNASDGSGVAPAARDVARGT